MLKAIETLVYLAILCGIAASLYQNGSFFAAWVCGMLLPGWLWMQLRSETAR